MDVLLLLLLLPPLFLPFIRRKWSLFLTYAIYGGLVAFSVINIWLALTNWSHMSEGLAWIYAAVAAVCLAIISFARHLYRKANPMS
jgi:hypothetical protein